MARNRARDAKNGVEIAFRVPKEGAQMSVDMLASRPTRRIRRTRCAFIDYLLRPQVIAAISDAVSYPNPNLPGDRAGQARDPRRPRSLSAAPKCAAAFLSTCRRRADYERARTRAWTRLKSGE